MTDKEIPHEYYGWWRIIETSQRGVAATKSEARNPKSETNSNDQNSNNPNKLKSKPTNLLNKISRNRTLVVQWTNDDIDIIGTALISLTGYDDRLRMFVLLAHVNCRPTKMGVSFTWHGSWEYDPVSGTGSARLREDGRLTGRIRIKDGEESSFIAERAEEPDEPIPDPPSYRDKWRRRW